MVHHASGISHYSSRVTCKACPLESEPRISSPAAYPRAMGLILANCFTPTPRGLDYSDHRLSAGPQEDPQIVWPRIAADRERMATVKSLAIDQDIAVGAEPYSSGIMKGQDAERCTSSVNAAYRAEQVVS